jgi:hypothetical protein
MKTKSENNKQKQPSIEYLRAWAQPRLVPQGGDARESLPFITTDKQNPKQRKINHFDVPATDYTHGHIVGTLALCSLMDWHKEHGGYLDGITVRAVIKAALEVLDDEAAPYDRPCKRGAAVSFIDGMVKMFWFASGKVDIDLYREKETAKYEASIKADIEREAKEREAKRRAAFVERMKAARAAKRERRLNG